MLSHLQIINIFFQFHVYEAMVLTLKNYALHEILYTTIQLEILFFKEAMTGL